MDTDASHDMADNARPGIFVVGRYLEVFHPLADDTDDGVVVFLLDGTVGHVDDFVGRSGKAADGDFSPAGCRDRKLHFIAVVPGRRRAQYGKYGDMAEMADTDDGVFYLLAFFL